MRILLINPSLSSKFPNGRELVHDVDLIHLPMGLLYIGSVAQDRGHEVRVVDMPVVNMQWDEFERQVDDYQPHMAGLTTMTATFPNAMRAAQICKAVGARVVMGGSHVTFEYEEALNSGACDYVIRGEGERSFDGLLAALEEGAEPEKVPGIVMRRTERPRDRLDEASGRTLVNPMAKRIVKLDGLPIPPYDLLDMPRYVELEALGIYTARGCPYRCDFCTIQGQWGRRVTWRSPDSVAREMRWMQDRYSYAGKEFIFYDDTFTVNRRHVMSICNAMLHEGVDFRWKAMTRVDRVDIELLEKMKEAGCFRVIYGIETTSDESLALCGKDTHMSEVDNAILRYSREIWRQNT